MAREVERRARATYDAIAEAYDQQIGGELAGKPLDRGLLLGFLELAAGGTVADVGCGPGHVARFLAGHGEGVVGVDISPEMLARARRHGGGVRYLTGSMLSLPVREGAWSGAVALYSIIHFTADERRRAFAELARALRQGGWLLVAFHVDSPDFTAGEVNHLTSWFGSPVDLDSCFLAPEQVGRELGGAGFAVTASVLREPAAGLEYPSRRCYLLARNDSAPAP